MFASTLSIAAGRWPGRSGAVGSSLSRGAKHRAAGSARRAFPWRQAKRAVPQARRREGLKPNGRDSEVGTGRSPKARRCKAPACSRHLGRYRAMAENSPSTALTKTQARGPVEQREWLSGHAYRPRAAAKSRMTRPIESRQPNLALTLVPSTPAFCRRAAVPIDGTERYVRRCASMPAATPNSRRGIWRHRCRAYANHDSKESLPEWGGRFE